MPSAARRCEMRAERVGISRIGGYFDSMVASGQLPELVKRANDLDAEIKD